MGAGWSGEEVEGDNVIGEVCWSGGDSGVCGVEDVRDRGVGGAR